MEYKIKTWKALALAGLCSLIAYNLPKKSPELLEKVVENTVSERRYSWNAVDTSGSGKLDLLVIPHRDGVYGKPIYSKGSGDELGEFALHSAKELIEHKNYFSKQAGESKEFYWLCRVDDFNKDGIADKISWPRLERMPVYEQPLSKDMQEKADRALLIENQIQDYIKSKI